MKNKKIPDKLLEQIKEIDYMIIESGLKGYYKNIVVEIKFLNDSFMVCIYHKVLGSIGTIEYFDLDLDLDTVKNMFKISNPVDYFINELGGN